MNLSFYILFLRQSPHLIVAWRCFCVFLSFGAGMVIPGLPTLHFAFFFTIFLFIMGVSRLDERQICNIIPMEESRRGGE